MAIPLPEGSEAPRPGEGDALSLREGPSLPGRAKIMVLAGAMLGLFASAVNPAAVSTALPRIIGELGGRNLEQAGPAGGSELLLVCRTYRPARQRHGDVSMRLKVSFTRNNSLG